MSTLVQQSSFILYMPCSSTGTPIDQAHCKTFHESSEAYLCLDIPPCKIDVLQVPSKKRNASRSHLFSIGSTCLHYPRGMQKEGSLWTFHTLAMRPTKSQILWPATQEQECISRSLQQQCITSLRLCPRDRLCCLLRHHFFPRDLHLCLTHLSYPAQMHPASQPNHLSMVSPCRQCSVSALT